MVPTLTMLGRLSECTRAVIAVPEVPTALVTSASMTLCSCRAPLGAEIWWRPASPRLRSPRAVEWRPAAPGFAALAIAAGCGMATRCARLRRACDRRGLWNGDPLRPASPRLRSPRAVEWRPAAPGFAALAIAAGCGMATRCARLRRACDRRGLWNGDPLRPASPRLRSPRAVEWRPAAPGFAALAIAAGCGMAT